MAIDTSIPIPIYYQIKQEILQDINAGYLQPGDRIESEEKLAKRYDISRMTARHAVTQLVNDGYLYRVHGKGTFVCTPRVEKSVATLTGFAEDMQRKGYQSKSKVISIEKLIPTEDIQETLNMKAKEQIYQMKRVRYANNTPISYQTTHLPAAMFPDLEQYDFTHLGLYETMSEHYDVEPVYATQKIESKNSSLETAELLEVEEGVAMFFVERITYSDGNKPMEVTYSWHRGDKYVFEMKLYSE